METRVLSHDAGVLRAIARQLRHLPSDPFRNALGEPTNHAQCEEFAVRLLVDAVQHGAFSDPDFLQLRYVIKRETDVERPAWRQVFREAVVWVNLHLHLVRWNAGDDALSLQNTDDYSAYRRLAAAVETSASRLAGAASSAEPDATNWWTLTQSARAYELVFGTEEKLNTAKTVIRRAVEGGQIKWTGRGTARRLEPDSVAMFLLRKQHPILDKVVYGESC